MGKIANLGGVTVDRELLIGVGHLILPVTIDWTAQIKKILKGTLYGRQTASKKYAPALTLAKVASSTNETNFVATLETVAEAGIFTVGDTIKFWDTSAGAFISDSSGDPIEVDIVDATAGTVTCTAEVFTAEAAAGDYLVIWDGTEDETTFGLICEDIDFSVLTEDLHTYMVYTGMVDKTRILRLYDDHTTPNPFFDFNNLQRLMFYEKLK